MSSANALVQLLSDARPVASSTSGSGFVWAIFWFAVAVSAFALVSKLVLNYQHRRDAGIVRSALALILVTALALLAAVVHYDNTSTEAQTLMLGAIATLASTVVAFYFSSRSAESARKDLLSASAGGPIQVPDLVGRTLADAKNLMSASNLSLALPPDASDDGVIATQQPPAGEMVSPLQGVTVTLASSTPPPSPPQA